MHAILRKRLLAVIFLGTSNICYDSKDIIFNGEIKRFDKGNRSIPFYKKNKKNDSLEIKINHEDIKVYGKKLYQGIISTNNMSYKLIRSNKNFIPKALQGESINISEGAITRLQGTYLKNDGSLQVEGSLGATLEVTRADVKNDVTVISPFINMCNFFVETDEPVTLLAPPSEQSWLESIVFLPDTKGTEPYTFCFEGTIDLATPNTFMSSVVVFGARAVIFNIKI